MERINSVTRKQLLTGKEMALENLLDKIKLDATQKAEEIIHTAKEQVTTIIEESLKKVQNDITVLTNQKEQEFKLETERIIASAKLDARKKILGTKQELIEKCFEGIKVRINQSSDSYREFIKKIILKNITPTASEHTITISQEIKNKTDWDRLVSEITAYLSEQGVNTTIKIAVVEGGTERITLSSSDGITKNLSLETTFRLYKVYLSGKLNKILFQ